VLADARAALLKLVAAVCAALAAGPCEAAVVRALRMCLEGVPPCMQLVRAMVMETAGCAGAAPRPMRLHA